MPRSRPSSRRGNRGAAFYAAPATLVTTLVAGPAFFALADSPLREFTDREAPLRAFRVAESTAQLVYEDLAARNFQGRTHDATGVAPVRFTCAAEPLAGRLVVDGPGDDGLTDERDDGTLVWEWRPGDAHASLTDSGRPERVRLAVTTVSRSEFDEQFVIEVEGTVGRATHRLRLHGVCESLADYALFSDGSWSEFGDADGRVIRSARWDAPSREVLDPNGWFDRRAALRIRANDVQLDAHGNDVSPAIGGAVREKRFWNAALGEVVTVQEIDLVRLAANGDFPTNGWIHSDVPIRLVRGQQLAGELTVVCASSIYTQGSFNVRRSHAAALISGGRIWHLSSAWSDDDAIAKAPTAMRPAADGATVIRAALVDGVPARSTAHYADLDGDGIADDPTAGDAVAQALPLLEDWGDARTLETIGPVAHLQFADMADNPYNVGRRADEIAWIRWSAYTPPALARTLDAGIADASAPLHGLRVGRIVGPWPDPSTQDTGAFAAVSRASVTSRETSSHVATTADSARAALDRVSAAHDASASPSKLISTL